MRKQLTKKAGFTLVEVIVSIVMVAIVVVSISYIIISSRKIEKSLVMKESTLYEINNIYEVFSSNPTTFLTDMGTLYGLSVIDNIAIDNSITVTYNSEFRPIENGEFSINCRVQQDNSNLNYTLYTLVLTVTNGFDYDGSLLTRTIKVGV